MDDEEVELLFEQLDAQKLGYVDSRQLHQFVELVYLSQVPFTHVEASVRCICGEHGVISRQDFVHVLHEIERRQVLQEKAFWDFQSLVRCGDQRIALKDALMLLQDFHQPQFSGDMWNAFLQSRAEVDADVYFDEILQWLLAPPAAGVLSNLDFENESTYLDEKQLNYLEDKYHSVTDTQEEMSHTSHLRYDAKRKLHQWNSFGIESLIFDEDRYDLMTEQQPSFTSRRKQDSVHVSDLVGVLEKKYVMLEDKLLTFMAKYIADSVDEVSSIYLELKEQVERVKTKRSDVDEMRGYHTPLTDSMLGYMGEVGQALESRYQQQNKLVQQLLSEGRPESEIVAMVKQQYHQSMPGPETCGEVILNLVERQEQEKVVAVSKCSGKLSTLTLEYIRLCRQCIILHEEEDFSAAAIAVGLAERSPTHACLGYNWDIQRSNVLAQTRLDERVGHRPQRTTDDMTEVDKSAGRLSLMIQLMSEMEKKQHFEREMLVYLLQGHDASSSINSATNMSSLERQRKLIGLRNQYTSWRESFVPSKNTQRQESPALQLFQEAVGMCHIAHKDRLEKHLKNPSDKEVAASVMADLQQAQELEMYTKINSLHRKSLEDLADCVVEENNKRIHEHFENIAHVLLGAQKIDDETEREYVQALQEKYAVLIDCILMFSLKSQYGSDWESFPPKRKKKELEQKRRDEMTYRRDGMYEAMHTLIGHKSRTLPSLQSLMGDVKQFDSETTAVTEPAVTVNLLADLAIRYDLELERLLAWLRLSSTQDLPASSRRLQLLRLHLETKSAHIETDYEVAMVATGLLEKISHPSNNEKTQQEQLALRRIQLRKEALRLKGFIEKVMFESNQDPNAGDIYTWREVYVQEVYQRQVCERDCLLRLLQDDSLKELTEIAEQMTKSERHERLGELQRRRLKLSLDNTSDQEEYVDMLQEAAALQTVCTHESLKLGKFRISDHVTAHILTRLQILQTSEVASVLTALEQMNEEVLKAKWQQEVNKQKSQSAENVFTVLIAREPDTEDEQVLQIVQMKYENLFEELLLLAGDGATLDKVNLLQLWRAGDRNGLAKQCLIQLEESVFSLMGADRFQLWTQSPKDTVELDAGSSSGHALSDLSARYKRESDYIKGLLEGVMGEFLTTDQRNLWRARLLHEADLVQYMGQIKHTFEDTAMIVGVSERQNQEKHKSENVPNMRIQSDRNRCLKVARSIWRQQQPTGKQSTLPSAEVIESTDVLQLQKGVLKLLKCCHHAEERAFVSILADASSNKNLSDLRQRAVLSTQLQRADLLSDLSMQRLGLSTGDARGNLHVLQQAGVVKCESRRSQLPQDRHSNDDVHISLLADLLQQLLHNTETFLHRMAGMPSSELLELQHFVKQTMKDEKFDNIAAVLFAHDVDGTGLSDKDVLQAVEDKYDALLDKLLIEALINELGETNWQRLNEEERQRKLMQVKLKQRQLKKQGLVEEASALLGDLEKVKDSLNRLMAESQEQQERRRKEKIEKRKKWISEGKTESECDFLEAEEEAAEQNILAQMDRKKEEDKASLMRQLNEADSDSERERQRQLAVTSLLLEQREVQQEDKFHTAVLMLDRKNQTEEENGTEESDRQKQLARGRLEAALRQKNVGKQPKLPGETPLNIEVERLGDSELLLVLMDAVNRKHLDERSILIQAYTRQTDEVREKAKELSGEELEELLEGLKSFYTSWCASEEKKPEQLLVIFQEAVVYLAELKRRKQDNLRQETSSFEGTVEILADLQQLQTLDQAQILTQCQDQDPVTLRKLIIETVQAVNEGLCKNVSAVVLATDTEINNDALKEVDIKYDILRDKLIIEALLKQYGEVEWSRMTEQERQQHVLQKRLEERKLRRAGRLEELHQILGIYLKDKKELENLLVGSQEMQKKQLEERIRRRKELYEERASKGLSVEDETLDVILDQEQSQKTILDSLAEQHQAERAMLMTCFDAQQDQFAQEKEKQAAIARLRREQKLIDKEASVDSACLIFSIGQKAIGDSETKFADERARQQQLAQERLAARKKLKDMTERDEAQIVAQIQCMEKEGPKGSVEERVLQDMDVRHETEREVLLQLIQALNSEDTHKKTGQKHKSMEVLKKDLASLHQEHSKWLDQCRQNALQQGDKKNLQHTAKQRVHQFETLKKALILRHEVQKQLSPDSVTSEQLGLQILTDLQTQQTRDADYVNSILAQKSTDVLEKVESTQRLALREGWYDNLTAVLFTVHDSSVKKEEKDTQKWMDGEIHGPAGLQLVQIAESQSLKNQGGGTKASRLKNLIKEKLASRRKGSQDQASTAVLPSRSLRREKTNLSEVDEAKQLVIQSQNLTQRIEENKERQQQIVEKRLQHKMGKRKDEAAELLSLGERQKTVLEKHHKDEKERQLLLLEERKKRVMYERTKTQSSRSTPDLEGFEQVVKEQGAAPLSKDEKMEKAAKELQDQFHKKAASDKALMDEKSIFEQLKSRKQKLKKGAETS